MQESFLYTGILIVSLTKDILTSTTTHSDQVGQLLPTPPPYEAI